MTEILKRGGGIQEGFEFQYWYGVKLIIDWKVSPPKDLSFPPWLKQEVGLENYGIFDDILMYKDSVYRYYQAKNSSITIGGIIDKNDLLNDKSDLSILKMFKSYLKIKTIHPEGNFQLIIVSNRSLAGILRKIFLKDKRIEESFIINTVKKKKKEFRNEIQIKCKGDDLQDFLRKLLFIHSTAPENEILNKPIIPTEYSKYIYNWVEKIAHKRIENSENKISYGDLQDLLKLDKNNIPLRLGFYSKSEFPTEILYDFSIDFFKNINGSLNDINWEDFKDEIEEIRKRILAETQKRLIKIEALTHLTIGFLIGFVFRSTTKFNIQIVQNYNDIEELWTYKSENKEILDDIDINHEISISNSKNLILCLEATDKPLKPVVIEY